MAVVTMGKENIQEQDVLDKIQLGKYMLSQMKLEKTGRNNFQKYNYFELKDFLPAVQEICVKLGLRTHFNMKHKTKVILEVSDKQSGTKTDFWCHRPKNTEKNPQKFTQLEGSIQTYYMRYLYIQMFELTESDIIDSEDQTKHEEKPKKQPQKKPVKKQVKQSKPTPTIKKETQKQEPKTKQEKKDYEYHSVEEVANYVKNFYKEYKIDLTVERGKNTIQKLYDDGKISEEVMFDSKDMLVKTLM